MPVSLYAAEVTERTRRSHQPSWRWVLIAAGICAANAGFINAVCLESAFQMPVSHMTGVAWHLSHGAGHGEGGEALNAFGLLIAFLAGSVLCGVIVGGVRLMPGRPYGIGLAIEAILLAVGAVALARGAHAGMYCAAAACGLQNALATSHCGMVIRTTHVTGIVTDLGILIGHWLRQRRSEPWKLALLACLLAAFVAGGVLGDQAFRRWGAAALGCAALVSAASAVAYVVWQGRRRRSEALVEPRDPAQGSGGSA